MTFLPQLIDNTAPGESLRSGATKINANFAAIAQEFETNSVEGVQDVVGAMVTSNSETGLSLTYDDENGKINASVTFGIDADTVCVGDDQRLPTTDQKAAISGTVGEPGANNPLVTNEDIATIAIEINTDLLELNYNPSAYTAELTPEVANTSQMAAHLAGINSALRAIHDRLTTLES